jgi:hypothetical protein
VKGLFLEEIKQVMNKIIKCILNINTETLQNVTNCVKKKFIKKPLLERFFFMSHLNILDKY